jgi:AraC family transcriptional activator of pyochelin receptor
MADIEQVHAARELMLARLDHAPALPELALAVGTSVRKLTGGLRKVFGDSFFGCLQEERLAIAYRLLAERQMNVATIAYRVGYSPTHLSVAIRKKFGVSPKDAVLR